MGKKRKIIGFLFFGLLAVSIVFLGLKIKAKNEMQRRSAENIQTLKQIANELPLILEEYNKPSILIYMNSECEHCQWQLKEMTKIEESLVGTRIILVSFEPVDSLRSYFDKVPFKNKDLFTIHQILPENVDHVFGSSGVPQIFIYNKNQLVKSYRGETKSELITRALDI